MKYIFHHLGLGDHIICNGMVREYKEKFGRVSVFCKPHNYKNVKYMYRDDKDIEVLPIGEDPEVNRYIEEKNISEDVIRIGFGELIWEGNLRFDEQFYSLAGMPFEYRFSKFIFTRDAQKEEEAFRSVNPEGEEYVFVHGDVDRKKIREDLKIIENPVDFGIFDILKILENATEIHIMESSIKCLVNSYILEKPTLYYHQYVRGYSNFLDSQGKIKFIKVN